MYRLADLGIRKTNLKQQFNVRPEAHLRLHVTLYSRVPLTRSAVYILAAAADDRKLWNANR